MKLKLKLPDALKSRKLWLSIISALIVFGNKYFSWDLDEKEVLTIVGSLLSFVLVEGVRDIRAVAY